MRFLLTQTPRKARHRAASGFRFQEGQFRDTREFMEKVDQQSRSRVYRRGGRPRGAPRTSDARVRILRAANALFAERGFDGTSLDDVVSDSRTSKGTLYHHFEGKEDLYATVLETALERMWSTTLPHVRLEGATRETFWARFAWAWLLGGIYLLEHPEDFELWRGFQEQWRSLGDAGPTRRIRNRSLAASAEFARRGQELGCIRSDLTPEQCAELYEGLKIVADTWFYQEAERSGSVSAVRRFSLSLDTMWRALAPPEVLREGHPAPPTSAFEQFEESLAKTTGPGVGPRSHKEKQT